MTRRVILAEWEDRQRRQHGLFAAGDSLLYASQLQRCHSRSTPCEPSLMDLTIDLSFTERDFVRGVLGLLQRQKKARRMVPPTSPINKCFGVCSRSVSSSLIFMVYRPWYEGFLLDLQGGSFLTCRLRYPARSVSFVGSSTEISTRMGAMLTFCVSLRSFLSCATKSIKRTAIKIAIFWAQHALMLLAPFLRLTVGTRWLYR